MNHSSILEQPAIRWEDALPTGNGSVGAMAYGNIHRETILLNREDVWLPLWPRPTVPDMAGHLAHYRRLLEAGKFQQADKFWNARLREQGWPEHIYTNPFCAGFDLLLEQAVDGAFEHYRRHLDFQTGVASVLWQAGGRAFARRLFVSRADDLVVLHASGPRGAVSVQAAFAQHPIFEDSRKQIHYPGNFSPQDIPLEVRATAEGQWLILDGQFTSRWVGSKVAGGFGGVAKVIATGRGASVKLAQVCWAQSPAVAVEGADEVLILVKVFKGPATPRAVRQAKAHIDRAGTSYDRLLRRHVAMHRELYDRVSLTISEQRPLPTGRGSLGGARPAPGLDRTGSLLVGASSAASSSPEPTNESLLDDAYRNRVPASLTERMFNFGRYLFIASTRRGGLPPNLQGVWNGDYIPAWSSDYTLDENVQMMHWAALPGNLAELMEPYFDLFESTLKDWQTNSRRFFGCRGIYAPLRQSDNGLLPETMPYLVWASAAGWLAQPFWDYYLFTGDRAFLRGRAVPFLKQVAMFYEDFLYEGKDGRLTFCPSMSPENTPDAPGATTVAIDPTVDVAVCREVLTSLCQACESLGIERAGVRRWRGMIARLPEYAVNPDGALREWLRPELKDNYHHRHQSHIYPLFPGSEITRESNPRLFEACRVAVQKRLVIGIKSQTGWSLAHMANIYARLEEGDKALECLDLLARSCTGENLWTYHNDWRKQGITMDTGKLPPYQMDANLGLTAAVFEMLAFSKCEANDVRCAGSGPQARVPHTATTLVKLLPALPARWPRGRVTGLRCRGQIDLSVEWDRPAGTLRADLQSAVPQTITLRVPDWVGEPKLAGCGAAIAPSPRGRGYFELTLAAARNTLLEFCNRR